MNTKPLRFNKTRNSLPKAGDLIKNEQRKRSLLTFKELSHQLNHISRFLQ